MARDPAADTASFGDGLAGDVAFSDFLGRVSDELETLAWLAEGLQEISASIAVTGAVSREDARQLQQLDLLTQTLADLARVTRSARTAAPDGVLDASVVLRAVVLNDLRHRLLDTGEAPGIGSSTGTVALF